MVLIGIAHDENGKRYYIAKNSWGTGNQYGGLMVTIHFRPSFL